MTQLESARNGVITTEMIPVAPHRNTVTLGMWALGA